MLRDFSRRLLDAAGGTGGTGGTGDGGAAAAAAAAAAGTTAWHTGVEAETIGFWQNKGYDLTDPKKLATELTKQYQQAERFIGAPPSEMLRIPKTGAPEADVKAFWQRLGAPADPKEYDFTAVKDAAGQPVDARFADAIRAAAAARNLPKEAATDLAAAVVKHLDAVNAEKAAVNAAKLTEERAALRANWKENYDFNHLKAMEGARRLGITPEGVSAMEGQIGYAATMEAMRKIGANTSEDSFVNGGTNNGVMTREAAVAKKQELMADPAWGKRLTAGDAAAKREWDSLNILIHGQEAA